MVQDQWRERRAALHIAAIAALAPLVLTSGSATQTPGVWSFDDVPAGRPPAGFVFASTPNDLPSPWLVLRDGGNGVLTQNQQGRPSVQVAIVEGTSFANLRLSARVRFAKRAESAGLVWRYRDADNYYLAALDLARQQVRIYRVVGGNRTRLEDEDELELDPRMWHVLKVEHRGSRMRVWINGVPVADARDRAPEEAGAIGLWSSGDAVAWFDDLRVEPASEPDRRRRRN